mmetsp:Transcript_133142/g.371152  ORF Transcript_133142/g.371152 Transcript_133142/m.371152 type:complete len:884 (+) Transcript_133142:14-2665(+)
MSSSNDSRTSSPNASRSPGEPLVVSFGAMCNSSETEAPAVAGLPAETERVEASARTLRNRRKKEEKRKARGAAADGQAMAEACEAAGAEAAREGTLLGSAAAPQSRAGRKVHAAARAALERLEEQRRLRAERLASEDERARAEEAERRSAEDEAAREEAARARRREKRLAQARRKADEVRLEAEALAAARRQQHLQLLEEAPRSGNRPVRRGGQAAPPLPLPQREGGGPNAGEEGAAVSPPPLRPGGRSGTADGGLGEDREEGPGGGAGAEVSTSCGSDSGSSGGDFPGYRAPIVCVMGHVDAGKTSLLDKLRRTNVQGKEVRGITQQIGATLIPPSAISEQAQRVTERFDLALPGLLVIDTPGHETFDNLRSRGASLCDIAIVVVNIKKGLEPQTVESLKLLREHQCPFVVALNQVDRLYGWEKRDFEGIREALKGQAQVEDEFDRLLRARVLELNELGLNCALYWDIGGEDRGSTVSLVPTSAATGQGVPDLVYLMASLTQDLLASKLELRDELECVVMEVRAGDKSDLGVTADVLLKNGTLREGDRIVLAGSSGPVVTTIKGLLTPQPLRDSRVKPKYTSHRSVSTSMGVKIFAAGLDTVVAGTTLRVVSGGDDLQQLKSEAQAELHGSLTGFERQDTGILVKASELGKLEALLRLLRARELPVLDAGVGEVQQRDVKRAAVMREKRRPECALVLAFDAQIGAAAQDQAKKDGVRIVASRGVYELEAALDELVEAFRQTARSDANKDVVFPVMLRTLSSCRKSPLVLGCEVTHGQLRLGTPLCVHSEDGAVAVGCVAGIQIDGQPVQVARRGDQVGVELEQNAEQDVIKYGKGQLLFRDTLLCSLLTEHSVATLTRHFRDEMLAEDWQLLEALKPVYRLR